MVKNKTQKAKKEKPKYNTLQNVGWMVKIAWKNGKRVLLFCALTAILEVLFNLVQLYIAPEVLARVEQKAPLWELLMTIGVFTAALFIVHGFKEYIRQNTLFPRVDVRCAVIAKIAWKCNVTSYPNTLDANFVKLREKAHMACEGNSQPTEHIWQTITMLLKNVGGLVVYLTILSRIDSLLLLVVIATCVAGFFVSRYTNNWRYARRDEEENYFQKKYYLRTKSESVELAKDIRIFGLQNWLNELLDQIHNLYLDFTLRCERVEVLADITEQKKLDDMRKEFVANVSHELRTPLTTVKTYTETLMEGAMDDRETAMEFLSIINTEADRMAFLVRDLLQLSRFDNHQIELNITKVNLNEVMEENIRQSKIHAENKNQTLTFIPRPTEIPIDCDRERINQVVNNILTNSIKYSLEGAVIKSWIEEDDEYFKVIVKDNGLGIKKDDLGRIFERFYRADKARSRSMGGTGLGLAIAKEIMEIHGGKITAESDYGKGTTMTLWFPKEFKNLNIK